MDMASAIGPVPRRRPSYLFFPARRRDDLRPAFFDRFFPADFRDAFRLALLRAFFLARFGADDLRDPPEDLRARAPPLARRPPSGPPPISGSARPTPMSGPVDPPVSSSSGIPKPCSKSSVMMRLPI
jgi:hypothetical protein